MKILIALSCPKNGWGHCWDFGRSPGRSVCLKEYLKSRDVGAWRTHMYFYKPSEETPHLAIPSAKFYWEYFEWFNEHPRSCIVYTHNVNSFYLSHSAVSDYWLLLIYMWKAEAQRQQAQNEQAEMRPGQRLPCPKVSSCLSCNMYCLPVSCAKMLQMEGLVCYETWPLLLNILSLLK